MTTHPVAEIPPFINPTRNKVNMNSRQAMNPDLVIPNSVARFIKKWGFVRVEEREFMRPMFAATVGKYTARIIFGYTDGKCGLLSPWLLVDNNEYHIEDLGWNKVMRGFS